jgi:5'-3' exonuclease
MGIDGFSSFIKSKFPNVYEEKHISHFAYKKICFDVSSYIYKYIAIYGKSINQWINPFITLIYLFRKNAVHVTFVFDGKAPIEKNEERLDRKIQKDRTDEKSFNISLAYDRYIETGEKLPILIQVMKELIFKSRNDESKTNIKRLLRPSKKDGETKEENDQDIEIDNEMIEAYIKRREKNNFDINSEDIILLQALFDKFKIPYIKAEHEAEALCNYLVKQGLADVTFSLDSDCVAYQTNIIINDMNILTGMCRVIYFDKLKDILDLTADEITLLCILSGCDYNRWTKNLRGIGIITAFKLIKNYKTLEKLEEENKLPRKDKENNDNGLRYERCVELFNLKYPNITQVHVWNLNIDIDEVIEFLTENKFNCDKEKIASLWKAPKIIFED